MVPAFRPLEAVELLHECLEKGSVIPGSHFRQELAAENLEFTDALVVLQNGTIFDPPEPDIRTGEWKYRIEGTEPGGKAIAIVFCFKRVDRAFLITVFSIRRR